MHRCFSGLLAITLGSAAFGAVLTVSPDKPGHSLKPAPMNGTVLPIWYSPEKVKALTPGLQRGGFALFRYPNGTLSNEYHWNGKGSYDSLGIWHPSNTEFQAGFKVDTRHRGTNRNNYGSVFPSMVVDADTASFWWGVTEQDSIEPWLLLKPARTSIDSVEILWGAIRPDSVRIAGTSGDPMWSNSAVWSAPTAFPATDGVTRVKLPAAIKGSWLQIRFPGKSGAQVREIRLYAAGKLASGNSATSKVQVLAMGTHPANDRNAEAPSRWDFETFMSQLTRDYSGFDPLLCVNVGTGTPEEAAAWVHFSNVVKKYGVKRWHVGNEIDGNWEQGGPLDPAQYAARFLQFVKAMKAADPSIEIYGPVLSTMDFQSRPSGRGEANWMASFLERIGNAERADGVRYLDGVDFHAYPYYIPSGSGNPTDMLAAMDRIGPQLDTLNNYLVRYLSQPETRKVALTEFNASVSITYLLMHQTDGIGMADMLGHMASRFGDRAVTCAWEPAGGEPMNPDGSNGATYGSLRLFTPNRKGMATDVGDAPTSAFWGQYLATQAWIERGRGTGAPVSLPVSVTGNGKVRAFALSDSGQVSVMVLNLDSTADSVSLAGVPMDSGEVLSWSGRDYHWDATDWAARALPNLGPSASRWKGSKVHLPGFGALVLRASLPKASASGVEMLLRTQSGKTLRRGDTLVVTATVRSKGRSLTGASLKLPPACAPDGCDATPITLDLAAWDGAWDGSHESVVWRLPVTQLPLGQSSLLFTYGNGEAVLLDTVRVTITDTLRPSAWIDRFDGGKKRSELPGLPLWGGFAANGAPETRVTVTEPYWSDTTANKRYFQAAFEVQQPDGLGYPNFIFTRLNLPRPWLDSTASRWSGITFDWFSQVDSGEISFILHIPEDSVKDYDDHLLDLGDTKGTWVRKTLMWNDFQQAGWGKAVGPLEFATAKSLEFRAQGSGGGMFRMDNMAVLGTTGESLVLGVKHSKTKPAAWNVQRKGNAIFLEAPLGMSRCKAKMFDLSGRLLGEASGSGIVRLELPHVGMVILQLEAGNSREIRKFNLMR